MDPNLLPENLRTKETKERDRLKNQPRGSRIELQAPSAQRPNLGLANSDRPKASWWQKLTGVTKSAAEFTPAMSNPLVDKPASSRMDWLASGSEAKLPKERPVHLPYSKPIIQVKPQPIKKVKQAGGIKSLFGLPVSPILSEAELKSFVAKEAPVLPPSPTPEVVTQPVSEIPKPSVTTKLPPPKTVSIDTKQVKQPRVPRAGWWQSIKGLFGFSQHRGEKLKFAGVASPVVTEIKKSTVKGDKQSGPPMADSKQAAKIKEAAKPSYNLVPKIEREEINVNFVPPEMMSNGYIARLADFRYFLVAIILAVLVVTGSYFLLNYLQQNLQLELGTKNSELVDLNLRIGDFVSERKDNNQIAYRVAAIKKIMDEKVMWSNFFTLLEKYTLDGVNYGSLAADTTGNLTLPSVATSYTTLAQQLVVFKNAKDFVKEAVVSNAQLTSDPKAGMTGVGFQVRLILQDQVFKRTK